LSADDEKERQAKEHIHVVYYVEEFIKDELLRKGGEKYRR
jgi:hypothetical protein